MFFKKLPPWLIHIAYCLLLCAAVAPVFYHNLNTPKISKYLINTNSYISKDAPSFAAGFACEVCNVHAVHGASVIEKSNGDLLATWFGGSREGGKDVVLWGADYAVQSNQWSVPRRIVGPAETQSALGRYIKTVGNSVLVRGDEGVIWLYYVSVSVGGWAGSALNVVRSIDEGQTWSEPRRLISSPFFNVSTLNKSPAIHYADGTIGLPVYHEFIGKFSELLQLDRSGEVIEKIRITQGRRAIQPLMLALSPQESLVFMRDTGPAPGNVLMSRSEDAGQHWFAMEATDLPNPDSAVAGLRRPDGSLLMVLNDTEAGRHSLALAVSRDEGKSWVIVRHFEQSKSVEEFSYPYLIRKQNGEMHLVYTWNRKRIRHVKFNDQWVNEGRI